MATAKTKKPTKAELAAAHKARVDALVSASTTVATADASTKGAMAGQVAAFEELMGDNPPYASKEGEPVAYSAFTVEALDAACIGYLMGAIRKAGDNRDDAALREEAERIAKLDKRTGDDNLAWRAWATNKSRLLKKVGIKTDRPSNNAGGRPTKSAEGEGEASNDNRPVATVPELIAAVQHAIAAFIATGEKVKAPKQLMETFHDWEISAKLLKA